MRRGKSGVAVFIGSMLLLTAASGFRDQQAAAVPVLFDTCSEYLVLSTLENELALLAKQQEDGRELDGGSGREVTSLPEYVTRFPDLYAPEPETAEEQKATGEEPGGQEENFVDGKEVNVTEKIAYLSFDDGPSEETIRVLDILKEEGVHATFFLIGEEITPEREEIVRRIVEEGHSIGLHTYCHDYKQMYSSVDAFLEDYEKVYQRIYEVTGVRPVIFRFPGGSKNRYVSSIKDEVVAEMERRGFCYYDWNVSAEDMVGTPTAYSIRTNIFKDVFRYDEPVILMHDSKANKLTVSLLADVIKEIRKAGYSFDTLEHRECCQFR